MMSHTSLGNRTLVDIVPGLKTKLFRRFLQVLLLYRIAFDRHHGRAKQRVLGLLRDGWLDEVDGERVVEWPAFVALERNDSQIW